VRPLANRVLPVIAAALLLAATLTAYAWRVVFDSDQFADRATAALRDANVRDAVAERVTDELVRRHPNLLAARPAVVTAVSGVVGGDAFASLFKRGVRDVHGAVFRRDQDTVTLAVVDLGVVVAAALRVLRPELAREIGDREPATLFERHLGRYGGDLTRLGNHVRILAIVLALLAVAAAVALLVLSADRYDAAWRLGVAVAVAGAVIVVAQAVARALVLDRFSEPDARAAAGAVWSAYLGDLRTAGWLIAGTGAVLAAAARSLIRPIEVELPLRRVWRALGMPLESTWLQALRGLALIALGVLLIAEPALLVQVAFVIAGVYVLYKGIEAILRLINGPGDARERRRRPRARRLVAAAVAALLVAGAAVAFAGGGGIDEPERAVGRCEGHAELCDRPLDQITLPATHNSMSVPLPGWFAPLQEHPIDRQLRDGIRGLLLDTHYADRLPNGRTRTYFASQQDMARQIAQDGVSQASVDAALRLRERLGFRGKGERGMYLCHTFCELGSTPLADVLDDIRDFLVAHPDDVLVVVNEDYVIPADFVAALEKAGLTDYALEPPQGAAWPTLRELIERDQRLLVLAENHAGAAPWYQLAYERLVQETPFSFSRTSQLTDAASLEASCRPSRGTPDAPLFLVNHWINTDPAPRPSNASIVNAYEPLLRRARTCASTRKHSVNLLAVDFYERGDLFRVVDALNRVPGAG
jgi:uncharacterized membrane protein HdeD (DUF308 family)